MLDNNNLRFWMIMMNLTIVTKQTNKLMMMAKKNEEVKIYNEPA